LFFLGLCAVLRHCFGPSCVVSCVLVLLLWAFCVRCFMRFGPVVVGFLRAFGVSGFRCLMQGSWWSGYQPVHAWWHCVKCFSPFSKIPIWCQIHGIVNWTPAGGRVYPPFWHCVKCFSPVSKIPIWCQIHGIVNWTPAGGRLDPPFWHCVKCFSLFFKIPNGMSNAWYCKLDVRRSARFCTISTLYGVLQLIIDNPNVMSNPTLCELDLRWSVRIYIISTVLEVLQLTFRNPNMM